CYAFRRRSHGGASMRSWSPSRMLMLSVALAACGGSAERETDESVRILSFVAEPEEIREGEVATLSWRTKNAKKLHLYAGEEEIELPEGSAAEGSLEVKPE